MMQGLDSKLNTQHVTLICNYEVKERNSGKVDGSPNDFNQISCNWSRYFNLPPP